MNKNVAAEVSQLMLKITEELNSSLIHVWETSSNEEREAYKKAIGKILGLMLFDIMNPLYSSYPDLKPKEWDMLG